MHKYIILIEDHYSRGYAIVEGMKEAREIIEDARKRRKRVIDVYEIKDLLYNVKKGMGL